MKARTADYQQMLDAYSHARGDPGGFRGQPHRSPGGA